MKHIKITAYLIIIIFLILYSPQMTEIYEYGLYYCYASTFNYMFVGTILSAGYIFFLMDKVNYASDINFICRVSQKRLIIKMELWEIFSIALKYTLFLNFAFYIIISLILKSIIIFDEKMYIYYFSCMLAQMTGWIIMGSIYILFFNLTERNILSMFSTELIILYTFFAQSMTFSFRDYFFHIYNHMVLDYSNIDLMLYMKKILINITICIIIGLINLYAYNMKSIYGVNTTYEKE